MTASIQKLPPTTNSDWNRMDENRTSVYNKTMFKNKRFVILSVLCIIFSMSSVFALDDLEGTAETVSGTTVYKAKVLSDQSFANVFGVKGDNTKYESHGLVEINGGTVTNSVIGARGIGSSDPVYASYNKVNSTNGTIGTVYGYTGVRRGINGSLFLSLLF